MPAFLIDDFFFTEAAIRIRRDFMGQEPEEAGNIYFQPASLLAMKTSPRSPIHWERWEVLRQLAMAHETLATLAWEEELNRYAIQVGLEPTAPKGSWWAELAEEQLKENSWATRQSSWYRQGRPRKGLRPFTAAPSGPRPQPGRPL